MRDGQERRINYLVAIMAVIVSTVVLVTTGVFYRAHVEVVRQRLAEAVQTQARWIESVSAFDAEFSVQDYPGGAFEATMSQLRAAHDAYVESEESEEFMLAELQGGTIVFLLAERQGSSVLLTPVPMVGEIADPARRALAGDAGTMVGLDYRGTKVLAAYQPLQIDGRTLGVVAKIDLAGVRAPFLRAGLLIGLVGLILSSIGAWLFLRIGEPLVRDLEASEQRFRELAKDRADSLSLLNGVLTGATDAIYAKDSAGRYVVANAAVAAAMGRSLPEILGKSDVELLGPETGAAIQETDREVMSEGSVRTLEEEVETPRGMRTILSSRGVYHGGDGRPQGVFGISRDITERKEVEVALLRSQRDLSFRNRITRAFLTASTDEILFTQVLDVLREATDSTFGIFGYIDDAGALVVPSMTRHIWSECQVPDKQIVFPRESWGESIWPRAIRQRKVLFDNQRSELIPEGHLPIERNVALPIIDRGVVIGLLQVANKPTDYDQEDLDILKGLTEQIAPILGARLQRDRFEKGRVRAELELRHAADTLKRSNDDLQQFAYVASHDLQEPLRMVASFTQLLGDRYRGKLDSDADDFIGFAVDGANRMQGLIQGLLEYSRVGANGKEHGVTDCGEVLDQVLFDLKPTIEKAAAEIVVGDLPTVIGDRNQLGRVFQNLVGNALKFRDGAQSRIEIGAEANDGLWRFWVKDNGIGIDPEYADRLFLIFQRFHSRDKYPGTGLGLAICKRIIEQHEGKIWVESQAGSGATFFFTIPGRKIEA